MGQTKADQKATGRYLGGDAPLVSRWALTTSPVTGNYVVSILLDRKDEGTLHLKRQPFDQNSQPSVNSSLEAGICSLHPHVH